MAKDGEYVRIELTRDELDKVIDALGGTFRHADVRSGKFDFGELEDELVRLEPLKHALEKVRFLATRKVQVIDAAA